ncbi:MAG: hypothetical protein SGPRY_013797 [Prymnesium sp.]
MDPTGGKIMPYRDAIERYATKWHQAGHPVFSEYTRQRLSDESVELSRRERVALLIAEEGQGTMPDPLRPEHGRTKSGGEQVMGDDPPSPSQSPPSSLHAVPARRREAREVQATKWKATGACHNSCCWPRRGGKAMRSERVVPVRRTDHAIEALLLINPDHILVLADLRANSVAHEVTDAVRALFYQDTASPPVAYRITGNEEGTVWAAAVQQGKRQAYPVNPRRKGSTGWIKGLAWFTLVTLGRQTPIAQMAICAIKQFVTHDGSTTSLMPIGRDALDVLKAKPGKGPPLLTPMRALGIRQLQDAMTGDQSHLAPYYRMWAESISPLQLSEAPVDLLDAQLDLLDKALDHELFAHRLPIYELPWLKRMPRQEYTTRGCENFRPESALDLLDLAAQREVKEWIAKARLDLACLEEHGPACDRKDKPPLTVIGQERFVRCARGYVWDCRQEGRCALLDHQAPIDTQFNLPRLTRLFEGYPDQRLTSNVLEDIRLVEDVELQLVLHPNLVSVGNGYDSVQATVRELAGQGFYDLHRFLPFAPAYWVPEWLAAHRDRRVKNWSRERYGHVKWGDQETRQATIRHKFPKEHKPQQLADVMRDVAILAKASLELGEPLFVWVEDAAHYFNQFGYAPEELWKSTLAVGARDGDQTTENFKFEPGEVVFVSEKRLGFGSYASSNIAQRFSNALIAWVLEEFDGLEARHDGSSPLAHTTAWRARRRGLEEGCRKARPTRTGQAETQTAHRHA